MLFPVLWAGWECDDKAWVMERPDGTRYLKLSTYEDAYKFCGSEWQPGELREKIAEYESVLKKSREALAMLTPNVVMGGEVKP